MYEEYPFNNCAACATVSVGGRFTNMWMCAKSSPNANSIIDIFFLAATSFIAFCIMPIVFGFLNILYLYFVTKTKCCQLYWWPTSLTDGSLFFAVAMLFI